MTRSIKEVLSEKKGIADALGIMMVGMAMLVAVGLIVANYAILSAQASQVQTLTREITNRAEEYAGELNIDLVNPAQPNLGTVCMDGESTCTTIISDKLSGDRRTRVLEIAGDAERPVLAPAPDCEEGEKCNGHTLIRQVTLDSKVVTHVSGVDKDGNNTWTLSDEGLHYSIWELGKGEPAVVDPDDTVAIGTGTTWVSVTERAGIDSNGALWLWGKNTIGQAGIGSAGSTPAAPRKFTGATGFRSVVTADDRGYAIDFKGDAWVWGKNDKGQLGLGHANPVMTPTRISGARMMEFAVGKDNVFMLRMDGTLSVAGASQAGFPANSGFAAQILTPGTKYRAVAASTAGAVATLDSTGKLSLAGHTYPFTPLAGGLFTSVTLGPTTGYAIGNDGRAYVWGQGANGQLGLGATSSAATPTQLPGIDVVAVSAAKTSAFAIDRAGKLYYFGKTPAGTTDRDLPQVNVPTKLLPESRFRDVSANSGDTTVALLDTASNVYGMGTAKETPGLWPMTYLGVNDQPIRMPALEGFAARVRN